MRLYVKDNSGDYKQTNDISKYLSSFTLENATSSSGLNGKECVFTADYNGEEQNTAVTKFTVKQARLLRSRDLPMRTIELSLPQYCLMTTTQLLMELPQATMLFTQTQK